MALVRVLIRRSINTLNIITKARNMTNTCMDRIQDRARNSHVHWSGKILNREALDNYLPNGNSNLTFPPANRAKWSTIKSIRNNRASYFTLNHHQTIVNGSDALKRLGKESLSCNTLVSTFVSIYSITGKVWGI